MTNPSSLRARRPFQPVRLALALGGIMLLLAAATAGRAGAPERRPLPDAGVASLSPALRVLGPSEPVRLGDGRP